ncbi:tetratricopeptide repeat protein [candidate division KSB1 bacterium]|nr:SpoIIE family protein phosphatase [candidate division KSB1 bacterium]RQW00658.1 MAG: tetratricopeptide repeat protein [candidate division KSB1 bacterium]
MFKTVAKEELRVPGRVEYLGELRDFVTRVGKKYGFSERIINAFKLSIDEAATNIIKHAYRDWDGDVTLRVMAKKDSLTMVLIDQGKYFDPRQVNSPDLQRYVEIGKKGGLGIFIMRRLLDKIEYRKSEEGNELWMVKNRDEEKKKKISITSIPLSLKMRYWLFSLAIFTTIFVAIAFFIFATQKQQVLNDYISAGRLACETLEDYIIHYWKSQAIEPDVYYAFKEMGSKELGIIDGALDGIKDLQDSEEYGDISSEIIITNNRKLLIASSDSTKAERIWLDSTQVYVPDDAKMLEEFDDSSVYLFDDESGDRIVDIVWPILDDDKTKLADTHFRIDYELIERDISRYARGFIGELLLIWLIVSASLFLLIYVMMTPFKRLQKWVKRLSEPGVAEEMDIDSSTEIGAIAQAFHDVTAQLKRSQVDLAEQERLQQEMHIAKQIQQTLLPAEFPEVEGYDISSFYAAAKDVGGDFYDFVEVDKDTLGVAVADVSGKGVPGAFVMTMIRTALRSEARGVKDAAEVLAKVNEFVVDDIKKGMFVTLFYVIIDSKRRRLNFASAGHNPMILHRPSKNKTYYLNPRGFPIGISLPDKDLFRKSIQSDTIALAEDDILLVYTDGVTEAMNPKRKLFGEERFLRMIRECGKQKAEDFVESLKKEMNTFTEGSEQSDDITLVAIKEKMSAERVEYNRAVHAYELIMEGVGIKEACRDAGISTYSYYQKYKEKFDSVGVGSFTASADMDQIEAKHLSIEEKNKIFDVIRRFPEYGAKRIADELNTERYEFTEIPVSRIYEELVRSRLNTRELRVAFVERGGKKKRIKPPGTPMMTIDGKIIMNRTQFEEPEEDEEPPVEEVAEMEEPPAQESPTVEEDMDQTEPEPEEPVVPNVYAMDKTVLLTAPLEDIFDKRSQEEDLKDEEAETVAPPEEDQLKELEEEEEDFDSLFGFVEDEAFSGTTDEEEIFHEEIDAAFENDGLTVVSDDKLKEYDDDDFDSTDEINQIEGTLSQEQNDLEMLSNYQEDEYDEFGFDFDFALSEADSQDKDLADDTEEPIFEEESISDDNSSADDQEIFDLNEELNDFAVDTTFSQDNFEDDDLFSFLAAESSEEANNNGNNGRQGEDILSDGHDFTDPFEEFLELEDEHGLIGNDGDLDHEISQQLLEPENDFADDQNTLADHALDFDLNNNGAKEEIDENLSLDRLVSVSNDDEEFFGQHDDEFDELIKDALSNDGKIHQLLQNGSASDKEENDIIETELKEALQLYSKSYFDDAIEKLENLAERFPHDHRAHSLLGNAYFREKRFEKASSEYERVIDLDPMNEKACENLAIAYAKQGELEKAIYHWERLLNLTPDRMDVRLSIQRAKTFLEKY